VMGGSISGGVGIISSDPLFRGGYHLASQYGRWDPEAKSGAGGWVLDDVTSPCIDAGDPASDYSNEPAPNGGRVNMGAYGNTPEASKSLGRVLTVKSTPVTGISIAGKATDHTLTVNDQQTVELSAPAVASVDGLDYGFIRWVIDGQEQPQGQSLVSLMMDADRNAVAVYFRARLGVTSAPYSGIYLSGSPADTTPYERIFMTPQNVALTAQLRIFRGTVPYNFAYWKINGIAQQARLTDIQFRVDADTPVQAVYNILGDANGDCVVNVLDLITIRNRLGTNSYDSWRGDVNLDGDVDVLDLINARNKLGTRCP
ncbi:MAG TPA: dockerin type I domain-containing protein, partial [Phycisphaerae bacterium]|nr:dockerin type I domain-containing protein [Phycisphaerae bacterium]